MKEPTDTSPIDFRASQEPGTGGDMPPAEELRGATVHDRQGQEIGAVDDVVVADDGRVESVVMEVGGYLGIGSRIVAVAAHRLAVRDEGEGTRIVLGMTQDELRGLPEHGAPGTPFVVPPGSR